MSRMGLVAAFVIIAASACSGRQMLSLGDDGASLSLPPAEEIEVTLDGNATTGFSWELVEYDAAVVLPVGEPSYVEVSSDVVGAGGQWTWILHAVDLAKRRSSSSTTDPGKMDHPSRRFHSRSSSSGSGVAVPVGAAADRPAVARDRGRIPNVRCRRRPPGPYRVNTRHRLRAASCQSQSG
jgi:predicted secreted protein